MKSASLVRGGWEGHEPEMRARIFAPFLQDNGCETEKIIPLDWKRPWGEGRNFYLSLGLLVERGMLWASR